jgi:hypothetical protein
MECQWIDNSRFIWLDDKNQAYIVNIGKNIEKRFPKLDGAILNNSSILLDKKLYYFKVTSPADSDSQTTLFCYNFESAEIEKMLLPFGFLNISVTKKDVTELYASADSRIYRINLVSKEVLMILNDNALPGDIGDGPINYLPQMDYLIFSLFLNNEKKSCIYYYNFKNNKLCRVDALSGYIFPHFAPNLEFFYAYKEHSDSEWKKFLMKDYFKQHLRD